MQAGVAQEPGRSRRLHRRCGTDGRDKQQSRPRERPTPAGANRAAAWYRQAKETKCGGTGVEKSESADSTVEVGEPAPRGPGGGKRRIGSWTVGRTDGLDTEPTAVSTQVRQLAERRRKRRRAGARFGVAMPWSEEPDARVGHVRICGSRGWETTLGHPARPVLRACTGSRRATTRVAPTRPVPNYPPRPRAGNVGDALVASRFEIAHDPDRLWGATVPCRIDGPSAPGRFRRPLRTQKFCPGIDSLCDVAMMRRRSQRSAEPRGRNGTYRSRPLLCRFPRASTWPGRSIAVPLAESAQDSDCSMLQSRNVRSGRARRCPGCVDRSARACPVVE